MNHAIVCVSIGKRPWTKYTFDAIEKYAKNINSDFIIESECNYKSVINFESKFVNVGRPNKKGYIAKALVVEKYLKRYAETMDLQSGYLKQVMGLIDQENKEAKLDEMSNDDLQFFEERKEDVLKKIGGVKNQLQQRLGEFYTKYIQMPMMGNFSYWDLTNPASLH